MAVKTAIVDDSSFFRRVLSDLCSDMRFEVLKEYDRGDSFLDALKASEIDGLELLFLDINMPGPSGKDLLEDILDASPELTIIMISTFSDKANVDMCLDLGATNYINKDTPIASMKSIILNTLEMSGLR